jgi:CheY-like chemotaxis protein
LPVPCGVLVVEDDPDLRHLMSRLLVLEGFDPQLAANGREALDVLRATPLPRLILLDLMMPVMDGWQFRQAQRADPAIADIPVIVTTAVPLTERFKELQAAAILQKPWDLGELLDVLRRYC